MVFTSFCLISCGLFTGRVKLCNRIKNSRLRVINKRKKAPWINNDQPFKMRTYFTNPAAIKYVINILSIRNGLIAFRTVLIIMIVSKQSFPSVLEYDHYHTRLLSVHKTPSFLNRREFEDLRHLITFPISRPSNGII